MDGCIVCGVQHIGSCNPQHPAHRPLSAEEWAEREARARDREKETIMSQGGVNESQSPTPQQGRWQTFKERAGAWFSRGEEAASQPARALAPQSEQPRRYDLETPGPTEAAGGSFQVVSTPAEAERVASRLPPSQEYRIDRARDTDGPTDSHVVTALPPPAAVARDPSVEKKIAALEDPEERAKAWKLLETIRSEVAAQERPISRERSKEIELER